MSVAPGIITHSHNNISKLRLFSDGTIPYNPDHCGFLVTPSSYWVALADDKWHVAMAFEFKALQDNGTWTLVPKPPGQNIISYKWVFCVKENVDGTVDKLKA
jgi:hypothetical protein